MIKKLALLATPALLFSAIIPTAPSKLQLSPGMHSVQLSWTDNASNETGYKVFRNGHLIASLSANAHTYHDTNLNKETEYHYIVKATAQEDWMSNVTIAEVLVANTKHFDTTNKQSGSWIKLYNHNDSAFDVGDYYLSNDSANPTKWRIHEHTIIPAHGYLTIWADKPDTDVVNHSNFKLKTSGGSLLFTHKNGSLIQRIDYPEQKEDISFLPTNDQILYSTPTFEQENSSFLPALTRSKKISFSLKSGFYDGAQTLSLSQKNNAAIYYTTDGSSPTKDSMLYSKPIMIDKTMVVRAMALQDEKFASAVKNYSYFIDEKFSLPVISIATNNAYLFDDDIGIYTEVNDNFKKDWMRPGSIEFFRSGVSQFSENIGIKLYGGKSRDKPQKSLAIFAKNKYGAKSIKYPLFRNKPFIKKVKSFVIRNSGNDFDETHMRDGFMQTMVKDMDLDTLSYEPAILFINGKYWGLQNIREKPNEDYLEANHAVDADQVDILGFDYGQSVVEGDTNDANALLNFLRSHSLRDTNNYNYVKSKVDIDELINYEITEIYVSNTDWPQHNIKYWKPKTATGKWRWQLYDTDFGFGLLTSDDLVDKDTFIRALNPNLESTLIFRKLLENPEFKNRFITRFTTHLNTTFLPAVVHPLIDRLKGELTPDIQRHLDRWSFYKPWAFERDKWEEEVEELYDFSRDRPMHIRAQLQARFKRQGDHQLDIASTTHGKVFVDGVNLKNKSYTGHYFEHAKVTLTAKADVGYQFSAWSSGQTTPNIQVPLNANVNISATFKPLAAGTIPDIMISEFNYKSAKDFDTGDWVELYNHDNKDIDLSGWVLKDDQDNHPYTIPNGTILPQGAYLVIAANKTDLQTLEPSLSLVIGDFGFGLGKSTDSVRLFNPHAILVDQVRYDASWPDAKGNGKTLSLKDLNSDNSLSSSWESTPGHGTPGKANP